MFSQIKNKNNISNEISVLSTGTGSCPRGGTWGAGGSKNVSEHGHVVYQDDRDNE